MQGNQVEVAYKEGKEIRLVTLDKEEFLKKYKSKAAQVVLAVPLRGIQLQSYTAETPLEEKELRLIAEDITKQPYTLALPAGEEGKSIYFLLGTGEPILPKAQQVPRFLAYIAELNPPANAIFVYANKGESLITLLLNGRFRVMRSFLSGEAESSLLPEVEKMLRFAKTQGVEAPIIYVPESIALDYAPLANQGHQVEVYQPEGLGAAGALRLGEEKRWLFKTSLEEKPSALLTPSPLGSLLALVGIGIALIAGGQYLQLKRAELALRPQYQQALRVEREYEKTKQQVEQLEAALRPWNNYLAQLPTPQVLELVEYLTKISADNGARLTEMRVAVSSPRFLEGALVGKLKGREVSYLQALREERPGLLSLKTYAEDGKLEVQVTWRLQNHTFTEGAR